MVGKFGCSAKNVVTCAGWLGLLHYGLGMALDDRTRRMLEKWEVKYGLSFIQKRLDIGLFAYDSEKQKNCYLWLKARQTASWIRIARRLVLGGAAVVAAAAALISALK